MPRLEDLDLSDTTVGNGGISLLPSYTRRLRSINLAYSGVRCSAYGSHAFIS